LVQALSLPEKTLLAMIVSPVAKQPDYVDPIEAEQSGSVEEASDAQAISRKPIVFAIDQAARKVLFRGGPELKGSCFQLVRTLAKEFEEDIEAGIAKDVLHYVVMPNRCVQFTLPATASAPYISRYEP
jgi:hypothetical protein